MEELLVKLLTVLVVAAATAATDRPGTHVVVLPNAVIPGEPLPVSVMFYNVSDDVEVQVDLISDSHNRISSLTHTFKAGKGGLLELAVPADLPNLHRYTLLIHGLSGVYFFRQAPLRFQEPYKHQEKFSYFVQTDRKIYKPGQTVKFRVFGLYSSMMPYTGFTNISIYDPKSHKVKQWLNVSDVNYGIIQGEMLIDTEPILGNWEIRVSTNRVPMASFHTQIFEVQKYVLPKFDVTVDMPSYVLTQDKDVKITVKATYTYGKPVEGTVLVRADLDYPYSPWKYHGDEVMLETTVDIDGETEITIPLDRIANEVNPNTHVPLLKGLNGYHLTVQVSVTESINNLTRNDSGSTVFYEKPYIVKFASGNPSYFKAGLNYKAKVTLTQADGRPVMSPTKDVTLRTYVQFRDEDYNNIRERALPEQMFSPPPTGVLDLDLDIPDYAVSLHLEILFKGFRAVLNVPRITSHPQAFNSIQINMLSTPVIGEDLVFNIQSDKDLMYNLTYMVLANDRLVTYGEHSVPGSTPIKSTNLTIRVTEEMDPYAQLVIYYFGELNDWNADSMYFNIYHGSNMFQNKVTLKFNRTEAEPAEKIGLDITTDPLSMVNILAVDQSVLLMATGNDIEQSDVISAFKNSEAPTVFNNKLHTPDKVFGYTSELNVLTDVKFYSWLDSDYSRNQRKRQTVEEEGCPPGMVPAGSGGGSVFPTGTTFCSDKVTCSSYGQDVCTDSTYSQWVIHNCPEFCGYCGISAHIEGCVYKSHLYNTGDRWDDGCTYKCECKDGATGFYRCVERCPQYQHIPTGCRLVKSPNTCCATPQCSAMPGLMPGQTPTAQPGLPYAPNFIPTPAPGMTYAPGRYPTYVPGLLSTPAPGGSTLQQVARVRSKFPETFIWTSLISSDTGRASIAVDVPDTITSWVAGAFAISKTTGLGIATEKAKFNSFRPFFVSLNLPYSVIRGEELVLQANVFNYLSKDLFVVTTLEESTDFKIIHSHGANATKYNTYTSEPIVTNVTVAAGSAKAVFIPIMPEKIGKIDIVMKAQSVLAADAVKRQLLVKPEGVEVNFNIPVILTPGANVSVPVKTPNNVVKGSETVHVSAIGDFMGTAINNLHSLLRFPSGCGEQTMSGMAPDIMIAEYLDGKGMLTGTLKDTVIQYMETGYQRELGYQQYDGSFGIWSYSQGSTWLTAFVMKSFHKASPYILIDDNVMERGVGWLARQVNSDGSVKRVGYVHHSSLQGGAAEGYSLTAYVLLTLVENELVGDNATIHRTQVAATRARAYLETNLNQMTSAYDLALTSYALAKAGSAKAAHAYAWMELNYKVEDNGLKYWKANARNNGWDDYYYSSTRPLDIETAAYGLLYLIETNQLANGLPVAKWLLTKRNANGGFRSTQDTVMGIQALTEYRSMFSGPLNLDIDVTAGYNFSHSFNVQTKDAMVLKTVRIDHDQLITSSPLPSPFFSDNGNITLTATGTGVAVAQVSLSYYVENEVTAPMFTITNSILKETLQSLAIQSCVGTFRPNVGMTIVEFGYPSGFSYVGPYTTNTGTYVQGNVKKIEMQDQKIVLYYDTITTKSECFAAEFIRTELIAKAKPSAVRVFEYYQPTNRALTFYESHYLKQASYCDVCPSCGC